MKRYSTGRSALTGLGCALLVMMMASAARADVQGTLIKNDGGRLRGMIRWLPASRTYVVTASRGTGQASFTFKVALRDVSQLDIQKPASIDKALSYVQRGQYAAAVPALEKIMKDYCMLQWDLIAAQNLAQAYIRTNRAREAASMCEKVIEASPLAAGSPQFAPIYWDTLLATDQEVKLRRALGRAIESGPRPLAAVAQVKRGDIDRKNGKLQDALIDGYLRTVILFADVKIGRDEALFKASQTLSEMNRHTDADRMKKRLMAEFPNSPYNQQLK